MGGTRQTIDAVQQRTGLSRGTVQRIKTAKTSVGIDVLMGLAEAFNIEVWELLNPVLSRPERTTHTESIVPRTPTIRFLVEHLCIKLTPMDAIDRNQAKVILSSLAENPENGSLIADKLERLLGEFLPGRGNGRRQAA